MDFNQPEGQATFNPSQKFEDQSEAPLPLEAVEEYAQRGPWKQYRLAANTGFMCSRCSWEKKAKLVAIRDNDWDALYCNACHGLLLSSMENDSFLISLPRLVRYPESFTRSQC